MATSAETFHALHRPGDLLILPNAWDAGSAKVIEDAGAQAIATTSGGVGWALGYPDGNALPVQLLAALVKNITNVIRVPLSVDVEGGYTNKPEAIAENLKPIIDAGAVGINIEDGEGTPELLAQKIEQARKLAEKLGVDLFINARTDVYLQEIGSPESRPEETIVRAEKYRNAGANGIFVPGLSESSDIKTVVSGVQMPVNLMAWPDLPSASKLSKLGVQRLSAGVNISTAIWQHVSKLSKKFLETGSSNVLFEENMPYSKLQKLFTR